MIILSINLDILYDDNEYINSSFVKSIYLQIYNRWGNLVFETDELDFKWDGTFIMVKILLKVLMYYE